MNLQDTSILELIPTYFREDATIKGYCAAFDWLKNYINEKVELVVMVRNLSKMEEVNLDYIASSLGITWYDTGYSKDTKVSILYNYINLCSTIGTPGAIEQLLKDIFGGGTVGEYFNGDGVAKHFKVTADISNFQLTKEIKNDILRRVSNAKNARSILDTVSLTETINESDYAGTVQSLLTVYNIEEDINE